MTSTYLTSIRHSSETPHLTFDQALLDGYQGFERPDSVELVIRTSGVPEWFQGVADGHASTALTVQTTYGDYVLLSHVQLADRDERVYRFAATARRVIPPDER